PGPQLPGGGDARELRRLVLSVGLSAQREGPPQGDGARLLERRERTGAGVSRRRGTDVRQAHRIERPPSTGTARPVMKLASRLARKAMTPAASSGWAIRPIGCLAFIAA